MERTDRFNALRDSLAQLRKTERFADARPRVRPILDMEGRPNKFGLTTHTPYMFESYQKAKLLQIGMAYPGTKIDQDDDVYMAFILVDEGGKIASHTRFEYVAADSLTLPKWPKPTDVLLQKRVLSFGASTPVDVTPITRRRRIKL